MSEFYVGYLQKPPEGILRFLKKLVPALALLLLAVAVVLLSGQGPFANSAFEFGTIRTFEGVIVARPYPTLHVARPGQVGVEGEYSEYLLVAPGKHGADELVASSDGQTVRLAGQLIYRDGSTMVEIVPGSLQRVSGPSFAGPEIQELGSITITGEIVDSKCFLGVMNPGNGKVHRDCAARCLSGGLPPLLVSADGRKQYLLLGPDRKPLVRDALREFIAEPISTTGELLQRGKTLMLVIDPQALRHAPDRLQDLLGSAGPER